MKRVNLDPIVECQDWELKEHQIKYSENGGKITLSKLNNGVVEPITGTLTEETVIKSFTLGTGLSVVSEKLLLISKAALVLGSDVYIKAKANDSIVLSTGGLYITIGTNPSLMHFTGDALDDGHYDVITGEGNTLEILDSTDLRLTQSTSIPSLLSDDIENSFSITTNE